MKRVTAVAGAGATEALGSTASNAFTVGVVTPGASPISIAFSPPYRWDFLSGVASVCAEHGAHMALVSGIDDQNTWGIRNARVDAFIFGRMEEVGLIEPALLRRLPFVVMDVDGGPEISSIRIDDRGGARLATQHLVDLGHRHFAIASVSRRSGGAPILHGKAETRHHLMAGYPPDHEPPAGGREVRAGYPHRL